MWARDRPSRLDVIGTTAGGALALGAWQARCAAADGTTRRAVRAGTRDPDVMPRDVMPFEVTPFGVMPPGVMRPDGMPRAGMRPAAAR